MNAAQVANQALLTRFNTRNAIGFSEMKPEKIETLPWDAPVRVERLVSASGIASNLFGIIAEPEGMEARVVGQYSKENTLLKNVDVIAQTEAALASLGMTYDRKMRVVREGGGLEVTYTIQNYDLGQIGHSKALPQIVIRNSYDGKWKLSGEFRVVMLVCLNGLEGMASVASLTQKHSAKLNLAALSESIAGIVQEGATHAQSLQNLTEVPFKDDIMAFNFFSNVARYSKGAISKRNAAQMFDYYLAPDENEAALAPSMWRGYMAGTRAMRDYAEVRPTAAQAANTAFGKIAYLAANPTCSAWAGKARKELLAKPPADALLVEAEVLA